MNSYMISAVVGACLSGLLSLGIIDDINHRHALKIAAIETANAKAVAAAEAHVVEVQQHETEVTTKVTDEYEKRLFDLRQRYAVSVRRQPTTASRRDLPTISPGPVRIDAAISDGVPAGQCAETTLMLDQLQAWVRAQGMGPK
jgi:microcystin degradation protein MlrC